MSGEAPKIAERFNIYDRRALFTKLSLAQKNDDRQLEARIVRVLHPHVQHTKRHDPVIDRFFDKVVMSASGCWIWIAFLDDGGYGVFNVPPENKAHRVAWRLFNGPIPDGMKVLHDCDLPCCVNPSHLFLGSQQDNIADMKAKGRARGHGYIGEDHPAAKLTWEEVREIRRKYKEGATQRDLAAEYGISVMPINRIVRHISWREE